MAINLTNDSFESTVAEGVSVVDFWAPWCGPCRMVAPILDELSSEYEGKAKICKVNTDEEQDLAVKFGIRSIPTILFLKDGKVVDQMNLYRNFQQILKVQRHLLQGW
jgi:thioredoxin 1